MSLGYCNDCKENSMKVRVYERKDKTVGRVIFCLNKGCPNNIKMPDLVKIEGGERWNEFQEGR